MERWSVDAAKKWWDEQRWPVGCNYVPSDAVNDVEMWMSATFNPDLIDRELAMARDCGLNSVRVFLPYIVWEREGARFEANFETFLRLSDKNGLSVMPVLFDDCAFDFGAEPVYGPQPAPVPGVHNSRWVPSPGFAVQDDPNGLAGCEAYVRAIVGGHRDDPRILLWDLYNEPGNTDRFGKCLPLLKGAFEWARRQEPVQPLTAGVWRFRDNEAVSSACRGLSDVISLHSYSAPAQTMALIGEARAHDRPIMVTEWMHRPNGSTITDILPLFRAEKIGAWMWGLTKGKTQTNLSWHTMNGGAPDPAPSVWQHDLLYPDGSPYDPREIACLRALSGAGKQADA